MTDTERSTSAGSPTAPAPGGAAGEDTPRMPKSAAPGPLSGNDGSAVTTIPAPPSIGKQVAQLIIIPAAIVIISISIVAILGLLVRSPDTIDDLLVRLQQPSGIGRTAVGMQDPRYLDRCRAAQDLAMRIPTITETADRDRINTALINTLNQNLEPGKDLELQTYLLLAIGMLGEEGGLEVLLDRLASEETRIVEGAVGGILAWPDVEAARRAVPDLVRVLNDRDALVRAEVAAGLGKLAQPHDTLAIEALAQAMQTTGTQGRDVVWNAGVALAKLGDPRGVRMVTHLLLDRAALAKLPAGETGAQATESMSVGVQDRVIIHTLANVMSSDDGEPVLHMTDEAIWDKIGELAENDSSPQVRKGASALLGARSGVE